MSAPPTIRRATKPSPWPRFFSTAEVAAFEAMGWTSDDWHDVDHELALLTASGQPMMLSAGRRFFSLREWVRNPPEFHAPISPALFAQTVAAYGRGLAPMALDALAAGASPRFVAAFLADFQTEFRFKTARPDVAWATTTAAGLSEVDATGWALSGQLLADPDTSDVVDVDLVSAQLLPWVDRLGPGSWLFLLAGFTLDEAGALKDAGRSPTEQQLRVMAMLNGHALPAGT